MPVLVNKMFWVLQRRDGSYLFRSRYSVNGFGLTMTVEDAIRFDSFEDAQHWHATHARLVDATAAQIHICISEDVRCELGAAR